MRVAIIGSRKYPDLEAVREYVRRLPADAVVVTGGARGVDVASMNAAAERYMWMEVYYPEYHKYGRRAPLERNKQIVDACDRLVAFWDGNSTGTMHTVGLARKAGKPVEIHQPGGVK